MSTPSLQNMLKYINTEPIRTLCALPGDRLAVGSDFIAIEVWDLAPVKDRPESLGSFSSGTKSLCLLPENKLVATISDTVAVLDLTKPSYRTVSAVLDGNGTYGPGHHYSADCVCATPDGRVVSGGGYYEIIVWRPTEKKPDRIIYPPAMNTTAICCLPDGRIVAAHNTGFLTVWNIDTGAKLADIRAASKSVAAICVISGNRVASGSEDGHVRIWNMDTNECEKMYEVGSPVRCVCVLPNGSLAAGSENGDIQIWNTQGDSIHMWAAHHTPMTCLCVLEGGRLASGSEDGLVKLWIVE